MIDSENADGLLADETTIKVLATCRRLLKNDNFGLDDNFFDFGGHSLLAMVLSLELESELSLPVGLETIFGRPTVRELCASLKDSIDAGPARVVRLAGAKASQSIYFIHAAFEFSPLSKALSPHVATSFVTINDREWFRQIMDGHDFLKTLEYLSEAYAEVILAAHTGGNLCLAGHSTGGIFAIETACKLEQRGITADSIFLFDTYLHSPVYRAVYDALNNVSVTQKVGKLLRAWRNGVFAGAINGSKSSKVTTVQQATAVSDKEFGALLSQLREKASKDYRGPRHVPACRTILFQATKTADGRTRRISPDLGWARLLEANLSVAPIAADHFNMVKGQSAKILAAKIKRVMSLPTICA